MTVLVYLAAYCGVAVFLVAVLARALTWSRMPMHVRWELYPVAHEGARASYGGSYMEDSEWWTKPRHFSLSSEVRAMAAEILFLVALREHNPKLWWRSFPFHFGLYLVVGATGLMVAAGLLGRVAPSLMAGVVGTLFARAIPVLGVAGLVLGIVGALGLLSRRTNRELRDYTAPADILNLVFFVLAFGCALTTFLVVDRDFSLVSAFVANLATFQVGVLPATGPTLALLSITVLLLALLLAYIPLTHMAHFVGKYFAYHAIRWSDEPNLPGGKQERVIEELLNRPVSWSAPHIKGDGAKTWLDVATEDQKK
jgi:nitrate reductase gamma subunit